MPVKGHGGARPQVRAKKNTAKLSEELSRQVHFNKKEVECLLNMVKTKLDRNKFRDILGNSFGMTDDMLMDRVFRVFDKDSDACVSAEEWVKGLSIILRGTMEEQIKYCFEVYDLNGDGYLSREEMFQLLKMSLVKASTEEDPDESVKDLLEWSLKKMDYDHDSRLSLSDYRQAVLETDGLLLESFGACLPKEDLTVAFLKMVEQDSDNMHHHK